ncbi:GNAT family N-acetyltransferase [Sutcliffiella rhizosphaerae]|uniref:N-acetyltransferase domain-containing protein n=1 Tax=Sutcliffiella rhizosphaerae TaxID=2880967 RepID=A0ABN8A7P4_9BACI|nr:GNAT family N-acetyltransferase [Sutcliffiella rhizosphaerae]CAG9621125.1 hypothetical protein BACCIP111883_01897 [Sutcliffiella rhizosphaerae]
MLNTSLKLTQFTKNDIPGLIKLSASVGWDYDESEIETVLQSGQIFGYKNEVGDIIASAAIIPYDNGTASIGMVIVNDAYRGMGLGKKATEKCIQSVAHDTTFLLIATEEGRPIYEKLGFQTVRSVHKMLCDKYIPNNYQLIEIEITPFQEADFFQCVSWIDSRLAPVEVNFCTIGLNSHLIVSLPRIVNQTLSASACQLMDQ